MRIWDIDPGFLNDRSLLGEHRELHGIFSILVNQKKGYANHPETMRWRSHQASLSLRHGMLCAEMQLRGFRHLSPLPPAAFDAPWPGHFIDPPARQYQLLAAKYRDRQPGRILLPRNNQTLWAAHKYSVMARDPALYQELGPLVARNAITVPELALLLVELLRTPPPPNRLANSLSHMWGYVAAHSAVVPQKLSNFDLLLEIRRQSYQYGVNYLLGSTALGELAFWCRPTDGPAGR